MKQLAPKYDPSEVEERTYKVWEEKNYFHAETDPDKKPYTIVMPPPNITGQLHMGHALDCTLQDILIRFRRMQGYSALWLPGTDHAAIATEAKIVAAMAKEGLTKDDLGRDGFMVRAWEWKKEYGGRIAKQIRKMGASCDWQRERFTMDEGCSDAVKETFIHLYEKGLIYRGERIINWCPNCRTSISDAEVEYEEQAGKFWHLRYPFKDGSGYIELATTRPETLLGDTAVAVNPEDERYKDLVGKMLVLPLVGREIPLIADDYVDMEFGTGVVKITPAHDPNDFEVGLRHDLPILNVLTDDAKITEDYPKYAGMDRYEARREIVRDLEEGGFMVNIEDHAHNVGTCYRCGTTVEPRVSKQWFVKMKPLAGPAIDAVKDGTTKFVPERFEKIYFHWLENIRDWCISRQLWWGHRIPAYYCDECGELVVAANTPDKCPKCGGTHLTQDPDTLDTWFSSALWPFSTLGWPNDTDDLKYFYPTSTLVTGYDIIPFWVMRMMFSGIEQTGKAPFDTVLIHGLVRDSQGRKMSKSLGNGIDPLEEIEKYGADALRFTLATNNAPGNDMRYSPERVEASRNFANKIWNAARFVLMNLGEDEAAPHLPENLKLEDKWILHKYNELVRDVTVNLDKFELGLAVAKLYDFIWDVFCDWYIEIAKIRLNGENEADKQTAKDMLIYIFSNTMKLLHPFMPFITEEIWQTLPHEGETIMLSRFPEFDKSLCFDADAADFERVMSAIGAIRSRRSEMNVAPSKKAAIYIATEMRDVFEAAKSVIAKLGYGSEVHIDSEFAIENSVNIVSDDAKIYIPLGELVDFEAERRRLEKEKEGIEKKVAMLSGKLSNEGFLAKAPADVVEKNKAELAAMQDKLKMIDESLAKLK